MASSGLPARVPKDSEFCKFDVSKDADATHHAANVHVFLAELVIAKYALDISYAPRFFTGDALTWVVNLMRLHAGNGMQPLTWNILWGKFKECYCHDTDDAYAVRQKLHQGKIKQKPDQSVGQYMAEFRTATMMSPDMHETDLLHWFYQGLNSDLKVQCVVDSNGDDWKSLSDLFKYAKGQEQRINAMKSLTSVGVVCAF